MEKLKRGDRVVVVKNSMDWPLTKVGTTGVIAHVYGATGGYTIRLDGDNKTEWVVRDGDLELFIESDSSFESQNKQILSHLLTGATLNPMSALELFGSFRLSARINNLRNDGHNIKTTMVYNGRKRWANYNLIK